MSKDTPAIPFTDQADFMRACGQTVGTPNPKQAALYADLVQEEVNDELVPLLDSVKLGMRRRDHLASLTLEQRIMMADAIVDSIVVLIGLGHSMGFPMEALWAEVHRSNMTKVDPEAGQVRRREDGKILKPEGWTPPDIARVLREQHLAQLPEEAP